MASQAVPASAPAAAQAAAAPAAGTVAAQAQAVHQALLRRVLSLTPEQISAMPPLERVQAMALVNALVATAEQQKAAAAAGTNQLSSS